ncbi:3,9-dihydroxypterocarpan 6A-monooxygenase [Linum perenne]
MLEPNSQFYPVIAFLCITLLLLKTIFTKTRPGSPNPPPGPFALPIIGHLHLLAPIPHQALHKLALRHGPLFRISLGSVPCVVASSPETAKEFLKTHESSFLDRPGSAAIDYLTYGSADFSFAPHGPYWKLMKKLCMSELLGGRTLDRMAFLRREETELFCLGVLKRAKLGEMIDVGRELIRLTNNVISRMAMRERCSGDGGDGEADEVREVIRETAELTGKFNLADFVWFCKGLDLQGLEKRLKATREKFDSMMERIINEHEEERKKKKNGGCEEDEEEVKDLLDVLLDISEDESSEIRLSRENIKAFILDIFAAGTDTSAITTEWALAELINHLDILTKLQQEIDSVVGKSRMVQELDIPNLPYLQAVVKETLRLHPTGPLIVRESTEDCEIQGYNISARTRLFVNVWAIGRDPNHWEEPLEFRPERFIDGKGSHVEVRGQHFEMLPFGSGKRGCPGTTLALHMVQTTLAVMVQCFEWKVDGDVDMEEGVGLTLPRANPLVCVPVARLHPFPTVGLDY